MAHPTLIQQLPFFENHTIAARLLQEAQWLQQEYDRLCKAHPALQKANYKLAWNNTKRALGQCNYRDKTLYLSLHFLIHHSLPQEEILDTLRHECAHILAGRNAQHGPQWQAWAQTLGAKPQASVKLAMEVNPLHNWFLIDPQTGELIAAYYRKPKIDLNRVYAKGKKSTTLGKLQLVDSEEWYEKYGLAHSPHGSSNQPTMPKYSPHLTLEEILAPKRRPIGTPGYKPQPSTESVTATLPSNQLDLFDGFNEPQ